MQEISTEPPERRDLPKEAAERRSVKSSMEESMLLQKEAAGLQEAMGRAVEGQGPVIFESPGVLADPEQSHALYAAQSGMLLLKVRVFLKTMRELEQKSMLLGERMEVLQDALRMAGSEGAAADMVRNPADGRAVSEGGQRAAGGRAVSEGLQSPVGDRAVPEELRSPVIGRTVSERLQSLAVSRALVLQLQAEAGSLAAAYAELEGALVEAGRAADQAAQIRLAEAAAEARRTIERAGKTDGH